MRKAAKLTERSDDKMGVNYPSFNDTTKLNLEINLKEAPAAAEALTLTVDGQTKTPALNGTACRVVIPDIAANNLGVPHTVVLSYEETDIFAIEVSVMSYVHTVLSRSNPQADELNAMAALYAYYQKALAYSE